MDNLVARFEDRELAGTYAFECWVNDTCDVLFGLCRSRGWLAPADKAIYDFMSSKRAAKDAAYRSCTHSVLRREIARCLGPANPSTGKPADMDTLPHELVTEVFKRLEPVDQLSFTLATGVDFGPISYDPTPNRTKAFIASVVLTLLELVPKEAALAVAHSRLRASPFLAPSRLRASIQASRASGDCRQLAKMSLPALRFLAAYLLTATRDPRADEALGQAFTVVDRMVQYGIHDPDFQMLEAMELDGDDWSEPCKYIPRIAPAEFMKLLMPVQGLNLLDIPARCGAP